MSCDEFADYHQSQFLNPVASDLRSVSAVHRTLEFGRRY